MGTWSTLNKGQTTSAKDAVEIQVERLLEKYQETLKLHQKGQHVLAKQKYQEIASHKLVLNEPKPKKKAGTNIDVVEESPLSTLRFLVFKNYASLLKDEYLRLHDKTVANEALQYYLQAVKIDPTEYSLWYHIGYLAHTIKKLRFARLAYETGFYVSNQQRTLKLHVAQPDHVFDIIKSGKFSPMQWKCLEGLVMVLYDIGDYTLCKTYIQIIMSLVPDWQCGLELKSKMEESTRLSHMDIDEEDTVMDEKDGRTAPKVVDITLEKPEWSALVDSLFKQYKRLEKEREEQDEEEVTQSPPELFVNHPVHIILEEEKSAVEQEENVDEPAPTEPMEEESSSQNQHVPEAAPSTEVSQTAEPENDISMDAIPINDTSNTTIAIDDDVDVPMRDEDPPSSPKKRKRENDENAGNEESTAADQNTHNGEQDGNDSDNDEEAEEDEAEEKRLSLRASKRQREKIENEETSRLKMLDEEKEFINRVQEFYDKLVDLPSLHRQAPWYTSPSDQNDSSTTLFWEWFDHKISELDNSHCWDVERESKHNSNLFGDAKGKSLTLFNKSSANEEESNNTSTTAAIVKTFITELNSNNSGISDSLCKLILAIIEYDEVNADNSGATVMGNEFLDLVTNTIATLEMNFVDCILSNTSTTEAQKVKIITRITEYMMDRLIRATMATANDKTIHSTANSRKKITTSLSKASQLKLLSSLNDQCTYWMKLLERLMFSFSLQDLFTEIQLFQRGNNEGMDTGKTKEMVMDQCYVKLRYWILKGKLAQCNDNIEEAYAWYDKCKSVLEAYNNISIDIKSMYDSIINLTQIEAKLSLLQVGKLFVTAKQKLEAENYQGVIEDLEPIIKPKLNSTNEESTEMIQMIDILAKAYVKTDRKLEAWNSYMYIFCYAVKRLMIHGATHVGPTAFISKHDDVQFYKLLSLMNHVMNHMILLVQGDKSEGWLPKDINEVLANKLMIVLRMSIIYIFRHPDFVPLVNNFTNDMPPHKPARATKHNGFNDLTAKAWVLQSHLLQHAIQDDKGEIMVDWVELLQRYHDELGERQICGAAKGAFLQHVMRTFAKIDDKRFRNEIYQCYHCLYGKHLATETDLIEEHHCVHIPLDQKAAEPLFALVKDAVVEKLEHGTILKTDLKDVTDTVSELFEDLPSSNAFIDSNKNIIEDYLKSDLELHPSMDRMLRTAIIPTTLIDSEKSKISLVCYKIFWIRGKALRILIKNRAKANNEKTMTDLETAIEEFTNHLVLNPDDADGWNELAACYQLLAEEELSWSASNIKSRKDTIAEYQRQSCHAYLRSIYILQQDKELLANKKKNKKNDLFVNFGNLVYSMTSSPLHMEAFKSTGAKRVIMEKDGTVVEVEHQLPSLIFAYKLALIMYNQALYYKVHDELEWRSYYMIGKCLVKIGRPPKEVLDWFLKAIRSSRSKKKGKNSEQVLEPIYIFCSYLVKYLYEGKIEAQDVEEFLGREKLLHQPPPSSSTAAAVAPTTTTAPITAEMELDQEVVYMGTSHEEKSSALLEELQTYTTHLPSDTAHAYNAVFQRLEEIRALDKKSAHHRPIYRISWMWSHVYHNVEKAKAELLKIFPLKVTTKPYINIWISGFELPGKHFEYHHKYTLFLIDLAKESNDTLTLKYLYKKLRRAPALLLHDKEVFQQAYNAYLEIIRLNLRSIHHAKTYMKMIKESKMVKERFEEICKSSSKAIVEDKLIADPELYTIMVDLSELRKLIQGFIAGGLDDERMDKVVRICYAALILGGETNVSKQKELETAVAPEGSLESLSKSRKDLRAVLLSQAKLFMQNIATSSK